MPRRSHNIRRNLRRFFIANTPSVDIVGLFVLQSERRIRLNTAKSRTLAAQRDALLAELVSEELRAGEDNQKDGSE